MTRSRVCLCVVAAMGASLACEATRQPPTDPSAQHAAPASAKTLASVPTPAPPATAPTPAAPTPTSAPAMKDGVWTGSGRGFRGDVEVSVTVKNGQITAVEVTKHNDDAPFMGRAKAITKDIVEQQRANVDAATGATFSSRGIQWATWRAIQKAKGLPATEPAQ